MGRLDDIAKRNQNPKWFKGQISFGVRSLFLLLILGLLLFTDWALSPPDNRDLAPTIVPAERGVDGVRLWTPPKPAAPERR